MRQRGLVLALCALACIPQAAGARSAQSLKFELTVVAHRVSGRVCRAGGRDCANIGCASAMVLPQTSDQSSKTDPRLDCHVEVSVVVTGTLLSGGRPVAGFVVAQARTTDTAPCWPDTFVAAHTSCQGTVARALQGQGAPTDRRGHFSLTLNPPPPNFYWAGGLAPNEQLTPCKMIPVVLTLSSGKQLKVVRTGTFKACA